MTKVRIIGDSRENERRINEEVNRQGRRQKLLYEAESSARQNAAVAMKWSALFDKEIPQELLAEVRRTCTTRSRRLPTPAAAGNPLSAHLIEQQPRARRFWK